MKLPLTYLQNDFDWKHKEYTSFHFCFVCLVIHLFNDLTFINIISFHVHAFKLSSVCQKMLNLTPMISIPSVLSDREENKKSVLFQEQKTFSFEFLNQNCQRRTVKMKEKCNLKRLKEETDIYSWKSNYSIHKMGNKRYRLELTTDEVAKTHSNA